MTSCSSTISPTPTAPFSTESRRSRAVAPSSSKATSATPLPWRRRSTASTPSFTSQASRPWANPSASPSSTTTTTSTARSCCSRPCAGRASFSSSSTVYGTPETLPLTEDCPTGEPTNPYGRSKLHIEQILADVCRAYPEFSAVCLRYFNPIGAHPSGLIGEDPNGIPNNLLPYVARVAHGTLPRLRVFGHDYPTPDGTGVRDFIHVMDLADGHAKAVPYIMNHTGWIAINLGCGRGYSVLEVVKAFEKASDRSVPYELVDRREGDIAANWCDPARAERLLGWKASRTIDDMCRDAWNFESNKR